METYSSLLHTLGKKRHSKDDILSVLNEVRMYIEDNRLTEQYAVLKFYSDWIFHSKIDRSPAAYFIMGEINRYLFDTAIMCRMRLPQGEELAYGLHMQEMCLQLSSIVYKMTGRTVMVSPYFWLVYFRKVARHHVRATSNYPGKIKNNKIVYPGSDEIQRAINEGNLFTDKVLKYIPSMRFDPSCDYSRCVSIQLNYLEVRDVIEDTIVFEIYDRDKAQKDRFTVIYEMHIPVTHQPAFLLSEP